MVDENDPGCCKRKWKCLCTAKETINNNNNQKKPTEWEKIFTYDTPDKRLISKIYKELIQLNSKITTKKQKTVQLKMDRRP